MSPHDLSYSRSYPVPVGDAFDRLLPVSLPEIFGRRYVVLPAVTAIEDQHGTWGTVGQTRTVVMADGTRMRETLTALDRPASFDYSLEPVKGPLTLLVTKVTGRWALHPAGTGTRITWTWSITPRHAVAARLMPLVGVLWRGFARQGFDEIERVLLAAPDLGSAP